MLKNISDESMIISNSSDTLKLYFYSKKLYKILKVNVYCYSFTYLIIEKLMSASPQEKKNELD